MRLQPFLSVFLACWFSLPACNAAFIGGYPRDDCHEKAGGCRGFTDVFDAVGACDLVLLHAPEFASGLDLDIHIRTSSLQGYSYVESAAVKIGKDVLEVGAWGDYSVNGSKVVNLPTLLNGSLKVTLSSVSEKEKNFVIESNNDHKEIIVISTFKHLVSVKVDVGGASETWRGLLFDGHSSEEDHNQIIKENWQVTESNLFQSLREPQYPQKCKLSDEKPKVGPRRLGETFVTEEAARAACRHWDYIESCVYDVLKTNDLDLATATPFSV